MTPEQVQLLEGSLEAIGPLLHQIGRGFYMKLFELAPDTRPLFNTDMEDQQKLFMSIFKQFSVLNERSMLTIPVTDTNSGEVSIPGVASLGERHIRYGVRPEHFIFAQQAFFWSLEQNLGDVVDAKTLEAWRRAFEMIIHGMMSIMSDEARAAVLPHLAWLREDGSEGDGDEGTLLEESLIAR